jgi:hypothetical protein
MACAMPDPQSQARGQRNILIRRGQALSSFASSGFASREQEGTMGNVSLVIPID